MKLCPWMSRFPPCCRSSNFLLRKIGSIRPYLSDASTAKLVLFLILSKHDCCNSTLSGIHSFSLNRLQKVQNKAARLASVKENLSMLLPFWSNFTGSLLKPSSATTLPHWLSGTLRILLLLIFPNCFRSINPPELFGPATKNSWKLPKSTVNLQKTDFFGIRLLRSGTLCRYLSGTPCRYPRSKQNQNSPVWTHRPSSVYTSLFGSNIQTSKLCADIYRRLKSGWEGCCCSSIICCPK